MTAQAQKAFSEFSRQLKKLEQETYHEELPRIVRGFVEAVRTYLSKRFAIPPGGLVYKEVAAALQQRGVEDNLLNELKNILDWCEAYHYGALDKSEEGGKDIRKMLHTTVTLFENIDRCIKK